MSVAAATAAGGIAGFVLGLLGAGGTVVGLPFLLLSRGASAHRAMGTNALGVALIAGALCAWRVRRGEVRLPAGLWFTIPGLGGILVGVRLGLAVAGQRLVFLLGFVLFGVAGWMAYLSTRALSPSTDYGAGGAVAEPLGAGRATALAATAVLVGATAGFFAIGGGFMIVPGLMLAGGLELGAAAATALLPIAAFALLVGLAYFRAGEVDVPVAALMLGVGMVGGVVGVWLAQRLSRRVMQRVFAVALVVIGVYLTLR